MRANPTIHADDAVFRKVVRKLVRQGDCVVWTGKRTLNGYPVYRGPPPHGYMPVHRYLYERTHGAVSPDLAIDHLCRNRLCVHVDHLEAVTHRVNILRGVSPAAYRARQTHCKHGHPLTGENLHLRREGGRACRVCKRVNRARCWARKSLSGDTPQ